MSFEALETVAAVGSDRRAGPCHQAHPLSLPSSPLMAPCTDVTQFIHFAHSLGSEGIVTFLWLPKLENLPGMMAMPYP